MSESKRLDIQFGSFACSVQGFDDPVQPVQQVLQALQSLLEETPQLADAEISFDAESIERLIGEVARRADIAEENVEIVPGLIIVHRGGADAALTASLAGGHTNEASIRAGKGVGAAWSSSFGKGAEDNNNSDANGQRETADNADSEFINIFSPSSGADANPETRAGSQTSLEGEAGENSESDLLAAFAIDTEKSGSSNGTYRNESFSARLARATAEEADTADSDRLATVDEASANALVRHVFADEIIADSDLAMTDDATIDFFVAVDEADENASNDMDATHNMFANTELELTEPIKLLTATDYATPSNTTEGDHGGQQDALDDGDSERVAALFGASDNQPDVEEDDEGYTAAGMAKMAEAKTIADLMVSAAAWMVLIQGQTTFNRKDVIKVFKTIPGKHSKSLEAQIKGFGKAVRNSQLVMIEEGVFGISRAELERFQLLL